MTFAAVGTWILGNAAVIAAGSAAVGAVGAYSAAQSQKKAANYNATIASQQATVDLQQGAANEEAQRRRGAEVIGTQAAGAAADGGLSGSNADLLQQSATNSEMDALNIRYGAKLKSIGATDQSALDLQQAKDDQTSGWFNAGAAALTSAGQYAQTGRLYGARGTGIGAAQGSSFNINY